MHECPHCGSKTITCRHCKWTWNPRDPENLPDTCPRCRNKWNVPFKWTTKSKYGHGTLDPTLKPITSLELEKLKEKFKIKDEVQLRLETRIRKAMNEPKHKPFNVDVDEPKKHLKELSV